MKKTLSIILAVIMMFSVIPMASFAEDVQPVEVKEIVIDFINPAIDEPAYTESFVDGEGVSVTDAAWFEKSSNKFIDETVLFSAGQYYIQAILKADKGYYLSDDLSVIINGKEAATVYANSDGTVTAIGEFDITETKEDNTLSAILRFLNTVKTIALAIIRFFGEMVGLK